MSYLEPADHPDRVARLAGRAVFGRGARGAYRAQPGDGCVDVHFDGLLPPEPGSPGIDRFFDDAAQGESDPFRERGGEPGGVERAVGFTGGDAGDQPHAA